MRLWHQFLIPKLPDRQLLGQHRECCALRGKGWGRKHATVDYVFKNPYWSLFHYHWLVMEEMEKRGFKVDAKWKYSHYRGRLLGYDYSEFTYAVKNEGLIYVEHDIDYAYECTRNLRRKGIELT